MVLARTRIECSGNKFALLTEYDRKMRQKGNALFSDIGKLQEPIPVFRADRRSLPSHSTQASKW